MHVTIECPCPPKANGEPRHASDTVTFRDRLDFRAGMVIRKAIMVEKTEDPDSGAAEVLAVLSEHYLLEGIEGWTLQDVKGKPVELDKTAVRAFMNEHQDIAYELVESADELYAEQVLFPLVRKGSASSPPSPMEPSTSAPTGSEETPPKRSRRSSTTTTPTDDTPTITALPVGDSSTSQKSA